MLSGVLVNILPLCLELPESNRIHSDKSFPFICPKGTINAILKKIEVLDQLKQKSFLNEIDSDEDTEYDSSDDQTEG